MGVVDVLFAVGIAALGLPILVAAFRPSVTLTATSVVVVNPLRRTVLNLADVAPTTGSGSAPPTVTV